MNVWRTPKLCSEPGCHLVAEKSARFCEKHLADNSRLQAERFRKDDDIWKMYDSRWDKFKIRLCVNGNVLCARLIAGVQCQNLVEIFHHLISPRVRPDLCYVPENVIPLCAHHHPPTDGTPSWRVGIDYVATKWMLPNVG